MFDTFTSFNSHLTNNNSILQKYSFTIKFNSYKMSLRQYSHIQSSQRRVLYLLEENLSQCSNDFPRSYIRLTIIHSRINQRATFFVPNISVFSLIICFECGSRTRDLFEYFFSYMFSHTKKNFSITSIPLMDASREFSLNSIQRPSVSFRLAEIQNTAEEYTKQHQ